MVVGGTPVAVGQGVPLPSALQTLSSFQWPYPAWPGGADLMLSSPRAAGRKTEQFQVSVSVAPTAKVTFELVYEELLKRHLGAYELLLKVQPQQLVKHLQVPALPAPGRPPGRHLLC